MNRPCVPHPSEGRVVEGDKKGSLNGKFSMLKRLKEGKIPFTYAERWPDGHDREVILTSQAVRGVSDDALYYPMVTPSREVTIAQD